MAYGITASGSLLLVNTVLTGAIVLYTWKHRSMHGAFYLAMFMVSAMLWSFTGAMEDMSLDFQMKVIWSKLSYVGIASAAPLWFLFALYYRYEYKVKKRFLVLIWIVPAFILAAAFTNEYHRLLWPTVVWGPPSIGHRLIYAHGPLKLVLAAYSYILLFCGTVMLITAVKSYHAMFRGQFIAVLAAALAPWMGNVTYLTGITPPWIDTTPLFFTVTGALLSWGLTRFHLLDIAPIAYDTLFMNMTDGVLVLDDGNRIVNMNPAAKTILNAEHIGIGSHVMAIPMVTTDLVERIREPSGGRMELSFQNGQQTRWIDVRISKVLNRLGQIKGRLFVFRDISDRKRLEDELLRQATTDTLTGVFNRRMGIAMLEKQLRLMQRLGAPLSICFADIDNLKKVNDRHGHEEGDRLIITVAGAIRDSLRELDSLVRLGGDEFLLILPQCTASQASIVLSRIDVRLADINDTHERPYAVSISCGTAEYHPASGESADALIARADEAMYADKRRRKGIEC